jgi:catechol 2,3-dioxygenase-like lactoylglutathione lyase family enzyme
MRTLKFVVSGIWLAALCAVWTGALAQLPEPNAAGVRTGHIHLTVPNLAKHREIWRLLGGREVRRTMMAFPGMYILLREAEPTAPSADTSANHLGFSVRDYGAYKAKLEALSASFFFESEENGQILADLPDGVRIEILTDPNQSEPIIFHHIHLSAPDPTVLRDWYTDVLVAENGERRGLPSALVPGGRVDVLGARGAPPKGSQGTAIDHIGFEVDDMEEFAARMRRLGVEFDIPPRRVEGVDITQAYLTDPAGTYIEITQGLWTLDQ